MTRILIILCTLLALPTARAAESSAVDYVRALYHTIATPTPLADAPTMMNRLDVDTFVANTSADFWARLTADEQTTLRNAVAATMAQAMGNGLQRAVHDVQRPQYTLVLQRINSAIVTVRGAHQGQSVQLSLLLVAANDSYRIADLAWDDIWFSRNVRGQFNRIYRSEGVPGLVQRMRTTLAME